MLIVAVGSKTGNRNFTFRAQADRCFLHAQMSTDQDIKQRWLSLGATWLEFADRITIILRGHQTQHAGHDVVYVDVRERLNHNAVLERGTASNKDRAHGRELVVVAMSPDRMRLCFLCSSA